ncbi:ATP-binding protein [bacterium]|nr:ATP-binding protein [bacterium]
MITRKLQINVEKSLAIFPVVAIIGSRQVGKTTLAKIIQSVFPKKSIYLDLELPSDLEKFNYPEIYLNQYQDHLVIIDEIQRKPELFPLIRALVDQKRTNARFLLLGSASPDLITNASESLAGRIIYHELSPFNLHEVEEIQRLWIQGGFPQSYLTDSPEESFQWRESFIRTYLERDIPQFGFRVPAQQLRKFWIMLAHHHGQLVNSSQIARSLGITGPTVKHYMKMLEDTFILRLLQPFHINIKKRLVKSPKVYIRDSGLLHSLLRLTSFDDILSHPNAGNSWEGFVIEQILGHLSYHYDPYFYRTQAGAELDLVLFKSQQEMIGVEIKYSMAPKVSRGFWKSIEDLKCKKNFVIYPGEEMYPISENVQVLPLTQIHKIFE